MAKTRAEKEAAILKEGDDWEAGKRGLQSRTLTEEEQAELDRKLGLQMITIRLPIDLIEGLKQKAAEKGMKYQPYIRHVLTAHLSGESLEERVRRLEEKIKNLG